MKELGDFERATPINVPPSLNFAKHGDQWIGLVAKHLKNSVGISGYGISSNAEATTVLMRTSGGSLASGLLIMLDEAGCSSLFVLSHIGQDDNVAAWTQAVRWASDNVGQKDVFDFWVIVSEEHNSPAYPPLRLTDRLALDGTVVEPADFHREYISPRSQMHTWFLSVTQLVVVRITTQAYDLYTASQLAAERARRLTGLFSIALGAAWVLRMGPNPGRPEADLMLPRFPKYQIEPDRKEPSSSRDMTYPDWIPEAWEVMGRKPWLSSLVIAFQEGLLLTQNHESYAAMAFVAIIEEIGNRRVGLSHCHGCDNCEGCGQVTGSGKRFRESLARVRPPEEAEGLAAQFYQYRSKTAHRGVLHGREQHFGVGASPGIFTPDSARDFSIQLHKLCDAAHKLLLLELGVASTPWHPGTSTR